MLVGSVYLHYSPGNLNYQFTVLSFSGMVLLERFLTSLALCLHASRAQSSGPPQAAHSRQDSVAVQSVDSSWLNRNSASY